MQRPFPAYKGDDPYIFVSYAHDDAALVYPEITRLKEQGFNIWYDEGIGPGLTWRDEVALALTQCKVFLYFITPRSVASSNCQKEVNFCLSRERKILSVHLAKTDLPLGLELSLSDMQAIIRNDHSDQAYQQKLTTGLKSLLPRIVEPIATPNRQTVEDSKSTQKSIAILPLVNRSNDADNEYLCEGISEELIGGLARVQGLKVASQLSSFAFKNQNIDARLMGRQLGVDHILSGSVQKSGSRVRISVLLSRTGDDSSLWSERYDRELEDIFELQEDVAKKVIEALKVELSADQHAQLLDVGTQNAQAYECFLIAMSEVRKDTSRSFNIAIERLQRAAELDPGFSRVQWWLHVCYLGLIFRGLSREEMAPRAEEALNRAEAAGFVPPVPWVRARRDIFPETRPNQKELALEACEKIRQPDPEWQPCEYLQMAECLIAADFNRAALAYLEHYLDRAQHNLHKNRVADLQRRLLCYLGHFDKAIELYTEFVASRPGDPQGIGERTMLYSRTGQYEKAEQHLEEYGKVYPRSFVKFYHLFWRGELNAATVELKLLEDRSGFHLHLNFCGRFLLGDIERGIDIMEESVNRGMEPWWLRLSLRFLPQSILREIEQHSRFKSLLMQFGIDRTWCDELMVMANNLSDITGIRVRPDDGY